MCIAIPLGNTDKNNESVLWHTIRSNPLYLLSVAAIGQSLLLILFWLLLTTEILSSEILILSPDSISYYIVSSGIAGFVFFALTMHFYPKLMRTGNIEYLYYAGFFFLSSYNLLFFYLASFFSYALLIASLIGQFFLLLFAFKPIWQAYYWTDKKHKNIGRLGNSFFFLILGNHIVFTALQFF